ncbi:MAG: hypothetical protein GY906_28275, partial [bacterium]|nr:hypothetical protein [bacterium]
MATRYYEPSSGDIVLWSDPALFVKADLEAELVPIEQYQSYDDTIRTILAQCLGFEDLQDFDDDLTAKRTRLKDLIDFFDYSNVMVNLNTKDGAWFTPDAVEDVCGEEVSHEADLTIDGQTNTYWEHADDEEHHITWELRDYMKRIQKLQVRIGSSDRNLLTDLDIYASGTLAEIDNINNRIFTGINFTTNNTWEELVLISKKNIRYIKFVGFGSQHASN